jgi:hypothetical protein
MTFSVHQHWDPLKVCVVGRSYPPEFYSWIKVPHVRKLFERIAIETEEDFQNIIKKLESFGVEVLRPNLPKETFFNGKFVPPPMTPRDYTVMIGETFYSNYGYTDVSFHSFYNNIKSHSWPECNSINEFRLLPSSIQDECINIHKMYEYIGKQPTNNFGCFDHIDKIITSQGNTIKYGVNNLINGAMVSRVGKDLFFGTESDNQDLSDYKKIINKEFTNTRNHIINTNGHSDGTYCPVTPGLIISLYDVPTYKDTFPDWEVVFLPGQSWVAIRSFLQLKAKNKGKWWIPGFEYDQDVINTVETWLDHWTGYVEETVFDVNMLIVDPKNVIVFNYNKQVFDALERYGVTPHIVPFRHRYFWDGGIHCVTSDLHREGAQQDFFPNRS